MRIPLNLYNLTHLGNDWNHCKKNFGCDAIALDGRGWRIYGELVAGATEGSSKCWLYSTYPAIQAIPMGSGKEESWWRS